MRKALQSRSLFLLLGGMFVTPAIADTLQEALSRAYEGNPTLTGARAGQKVADENVAIAQAQKMPTASAQGGYTQTFSISPGNAASRQLRIGIGGDYLIYNGGGVKSSILSAQQRALAGQSNLLGVESDVFVQVVTAYMDVLQYEAIVELNRAEVRLLKVNLEATKDRFEVGDLTRTDVAQSEARLALAESRLNSVEAQLIGSREQYIQVVGSPPGTLAPPPPLPNMPTRVAEAVEVALDDNADLQAAAHQRQAAEFDVKTTKSQRMPRVTGVVDTGYGNNLWSAPSQIVNGQKIKQPNDQHSFTAGVQATFPLYTGGVAAAQIRQSQARLSQSMEQIIEIERAVIARTRASYASWNAAKSVIESTEVAVKANKLALEGVTAENSVGTRTILDILDARQELLSSEVQLVTARRNAYVAGFQLLSIIGHARYKDLNLDGTAMYDPNINYNRVNKTVWDWKQDWKTEPEPTPQGTRTVDTPPQTPAVSAPPKK